MASKSTSRNPLKQVATRLRELRERHEERHRPSGFDFAFADRVDFLNGAVWDSVTAKGSVFLMRKVLRVIEAHGPDNVMPRYALIFREEQPVAALAAQLVTVTNQHLLKTESGGSKNGNSIHRVLTPAAKIVTARLNEPLLVAGNLMSWGFHGIAFADGEDPAALWPGVAEALYRIRRAERLLGQTNLVLVKDVTEREQGLQALRRFSYRPLETEPNMVLAINPAWRTYDDYLAALDAKYRRNAREQLKKLTAAGCGVESLTDLASHSARLHELYLAVQRNASVRLVTLVESYLRELAFALGDDFRCTIIRRGEQILGFVTSIRDGDTAIAYYIGFDRIAAAEGLPIYLRLLHVTIADAISWGCKSLSLGRTALEPKAALGAKPEPMSVWLRHRIPAANWILRGLLGVVTHEEAPERNPFKTVTENK
ncbi:MAG TPA: GNAT family N-acetyltransferase [Verrucomicrobiae bacterium]|nr:GNAT family N-acetyltransferase [Verrucomicrobiae bacterium]